MPKIHKYIKIAAFSMVLLSFSCKKQTEPDQNPLNSSIIDVFDDHEPITQPTKMSGRSKLIFRVLIPEKKEYKCDENLPDQLLFNKTITKSVDDHVENFKFNHKTSYLCITITGGGGFNEISSAHISMNDIDVLSKQNPKIDTSKIQQKITQLIELPLL